MHNEKFTFYQIPRHDSMKIHREINVILAVAGFIAIFLVSPLHAKMIDIQLDQQAKNNTVLHVPVVVADAGSATHSVNDAPIVNDDVVRISPQSSIINSLVNDFHSDEGEILALDSITQPASGTAIIELSSIRYTPSDGFLGLDSMTYTVRDTNGVTATGKVTIAVGIEGDCNQDGLVGASDLIRCGLEIFDNDGTDWLSVPNGEHVGNPNGCDANNDFFVGAADYLCLRRRVLEGVNACTAITNSSTEELASAEITLSQTSNIHNSVLKIPITFDSQGHDIGVAAIQLEIDNTRLAFDKATGLSLNLPPSYQPSLYMEENRLGLILHSPTLESMSDGEIATLTFQVLDDSLNGQSIADAIGFSVTRSTSLGDIWGQSVPVITKPNITVITRMDKKVFLPIVGRIASAPQISE